MDKSIRIADRVEGSPATVTRPSGELRNELCEDRRESEDHWSTATRECLISDKMVIRCRRERQQDCLQRARGTRTARHTLDSTNRARDEREFIGRELRVLELRGDAVLQVAGDVGTNAFTRDGRSLLFTAREEAIERRSRQPIGR